MDLAEKIATRCNNVNVKEVIYDVHLAFSIINMYIYLLYTFYIEHVFQIKKSYSKNKRRLQPT